MKKISMIELSRRAMGAREMNALTGGNVCGCGCHGPSSRVSRNLVGISI